MDENNCRTWLCNKSTSEIIKQEKEKERGVGEKTEWIILYTSRAVFHNKYENYFVKFKITRYCAWKIFGKINTWKDGLFLITRDTTVDFMTFSS